MLAIGVSCLVALALATPLKALTLGYQAVFEEAGLHVQNAEDAAHADYLDWVSSSKADFVHAIRYGGAEEWVVVMGNEAGDTDSMVSSMAYAWHLAHRKEDRHKAVALLQVTQDQLRLRRENELALKSAGLSSDSYDNMLTLDQLPYHRGKISQMIRGLVLVDHNRPLSYWLGCPVLAILDHHADRGVNQTASPRDIEMTASASSLVSRRILEGLGKHQEIPKALADLLIHTTALDSKGFKKSKKDKFKAVDKESAKEVYKFSSYADTKFKKTMKKLSKQMKKAEADLDDLNITQLYRRDYKGDMMYNSTIPISVGYANVPYSIKHLISRSSNGTREALTEETKNWTTDYRIDVLIMLTKFDDENGDQVREVILTVRHGNLLQEDEAERVYHKIRDSLEADTTLDLKRWRDEDDWGVHNFAWKQGKSSEGRKTVRPVVEKAVQEW